MLAIFSLVDGFIIVSLCSVNTLASIASLWLHKEAILDGVVSAMPRPDAPFGLRLPADLKARLQIRAKAEHRSMNAQIVALLEHALTASGSLNDV